MECRASGGNIYQKIIEAVLNKYLYHLTFPLNKRKQYHRQLKQQNAKYNQGKNWNPKYQREAG
ncbi:MAG: hypothetical protein A2520_11375 [Deltaproteobacteria bacterium RIFOXYD12_FULL_53_23]|nr:MAG: hypothetical protein A2520_11375 [Deltaproteobacteria bacterium RIFOXYD12_FULL_53_23]